MRASTAACVCALSLLPAVASPTHAQDLSTPEGTTRANIQAMAASDWTAMAGMMHPDALNELRDLFLPLLQHPDMEELRVEMFGITTVEEASELSGADVYQEIIQFTLGLDPDMVQMLSTADLDVIGHLMEGETAHVVYRLSLSVDGIPFSQMAVASYKEQNGKWLGLLTADLKGMIAGLEAALE